MQESCSLITVWVFAFGGLMILAEYEDRLSRWISTGRSGSKQSVQNWYNNSFATTFEPPTGGYDLAECFLFFVFAGYAMVLGCYFWFQSRRIGSITPVYNGLFSVTPNRFCWLVTEVTDQNKWGIFKLADLAYVVSDYSFLPSLSLVSTMSITYVPCVSWSLNMAMISLIANAKFIVGMLRRLQFCPDF